MQKDDRTISVCFQRGWCGAPHCSPTLDVLPGLSAGKLHGAGAPVWRWLGVVWSTPPDAGWFGACTLVRVLARRMPTCLVLEKHQGLLQMFHLAWIEGAEMAGFPMDWSFTGIVLEFYWTFIGLPLEFIGDSWGRLYGAIGHSQVSSESNLNGHPRHCTSLF